MLEAIEVGGAVDGESTSCRRCRRWLIRQGAGADTAAVADDAGAGGEGGVAGELMVEAMRLGIVHEGGWRRVTLMVAVAGTALVPRGARLPVQFRLTAAELVTGSGDVQRAAAEQAWSRCKCLLACSSVVTPPELVSETWRRAVVGDDARLLTSILPGPRR